MIVVFGSINVDLVTRVERIPGPGETVLGPSYAVIPGGKGANQALAARRAGARVALVGATGRDSFATEALSLLRAEGVDLTALTETEAPTGAAFIAVDDHGENAIVVAAGANALARAAQLAALPWNAGDILLLQRETPDAEGEAAAIIARRAGAKVILNLAPAGAIAPRYLAAIDMLVMNEHEAAVLAEALGLPAADDPDQVARTIDSRFGCAALVTLGADGALGWQAGRYHRRSALPIEVVDTTAAGDAFVGAFAAARARGETFDGALAQGVVAGSLTCTRVGAQPSLPHQAEIADALARLSPART
jgi:ribokinase